MPIISEYDRNLLVLMNDKIAATYDLPSMDSGKSCIINSSIKILNNTFYNMELVKVFARNLPTGITVYFSSTTDFSDNITTFFSSSPMIPGDELLFYIKICSTLETFTNDFIDVVAMGKAGDINV